MKKTLLVFVLIFSNLVLAQDKKKEDSDKKEEKTITDLTESSAKIEGLFTIYQFTKFTLVWRSPSRLRLVVSK